MTPEKSDQSPIDSAELEMHARLEIGLIDAFPGPDADLTGRDHGVQVRDPKKLSRADARLCAVETLVLFSAAWRVAAVSLLEAQSPLKNVVHGCMRT